MGLRVGVDVASGVCVSVAPGCAVRDGAGGGVTVAVIVTWGLGVEVAVGVIDGVMVIEGSGVAVNVGMGVAVSDIRVNSPKYPVCRIAVEAMRFSASQFVSSGTHVWAVSSKR